MIRVAASISLLMVVLSCGQNEAAERARIHAEMKAEEARARDAAYEAQLKADADRQAAIDAAKLESDEAPEDPVEEVPTAEDLIPWERLDTPVTADFTVDWTEAKDHVGKFLAVEGTIVDTHNSGRACFLNFTSEWRGTFYLAILGSNMDDYPESPERYFLNKKVRAVGKVAMYRDRPQIVIESPQHITVLDE